jgi:TorA maturation chaperone TorD
MRNEILAELWLSTARAMMSPCDPNLCAALRDDLADSLAALCAEAFDAKTARHLVTPLPRLAAAFGGFASPEALLVHYSQCFLAPPVRVPLELGLYLDGLPGGAAFEALQHWLAAYGASRRAGFPEAIDHLACVLELLALIENGGEPGSAADFTHAFLLPALPRLLDRFETDQDRTIRHSPYRMLLDILHAALRTAHPSPATAAERRITYRRRPLHDGWRRCERCAAPIATEKELAVIATALRREGLPTEHLALCPTCRDAARGWEKRPLAG